VNFKASTELARLLESAVGVDEIVVVDHSEDEAEVRALEALSVDRVVAQPNAGYGAGLNRGVRESTGDAIVLANPDLWFHEGAVTALVDVLGEPGVGIAAPSLFWDPDRRWQLPQARHVTWWSEFEASRFPAAARRRYLKHQNGLWSAVGPVDSPVVSGTVMAVTRETFRIAGGFDERYFLFYEENDFCMRVQKLGKRCLVVPEARVSHEVGVSAAHEGGEHLDQAYLRYRQLWFPTWFTVFWSNPMVPATTSVDQGGLRQASDIARWIVAPHDGFVPCVLGPRIGDADPEDSGFAPPGMPESWRVGMLDGLKVRLVR
jgi:GT2 family glycosyltransferase